MRAHFHVQMEHFFTISYFKRTLWSIVIDIDRRECIFFTTVHAKCSLSTYLMQRPER